MERLTVSSLLGSKHVEMAVRCLGSLLRHSVEPLGLQLHDDGSLTARDIETLANRLNNPKIVSRAEADDRLAPILANRAFLRAARNRNPLLLKLVDIAELSADDDIRYCDTDVIFLRPFTGLYRFASSRVDAYFIKDRINAYSVKSWQIVRHRLDLPRRVNTGVILFKRRYFDLDLLEWFFSKQFPLAPVWIEQTAWALLGGRTNCWLYDDRQICIPAAQGALPADPVGLHFVSTIRCRMREIGEVADTPREPITISSQRSSRLAAVGMLSEEIGRRWRRLMSKPLTEKSD